TGHSDHDAGVALSDADVAGARNLARRGDSDHRRDPRPGTHQARSAFGAVARTLGTTAHLRRAVAADRPFGNPEPVARRSYFFRGLRVSRTTRAETGHHRRCRSYKGTSVERRACARTDAGPRRTR